MDILPLLCIVSAAFTGLTKGANLLPDRLNAAVGNTVMFTTTLTPPEKPFVTVGWTFDGKPIITFSGVNVTAPEYEGRITLFMSTGSLELRNVALNDSGVYKVSIIPFGGNQQTGETRLNVDEPVSNVTATASSTDLLELNSSVSLSCSASGTSLSFLWLNGSSEVTASDRVQLTDGGTILTILNVTRDDQGPFRCHVSNPVSDGTSDPITFNISYGPDNVTLTISPSKEYHAEGSNINLTCSADSKPAAQFNWLLNGSLLSDTGSQFKLMNIQESQSGNYSCQAFNSKTLRYESSPPATISVLKIISGASITPSTTLPIEGNSVNLTCDAAGSVFTRKWRKDGSDLILSDNIILYDKNRVLSFKSLTKKDSGEYSCIVSNPVSSDEANYSMEVNYGPENIQITGPSQICPKENLTLTCSAESRPLATYTWILNGTVIHNSAVFTKDNIQPSDSGIYTCEAMNDVTGRKLSADHELSVTVKPQHKGGCGGGCIAGIVIAVLVVLAAAGGGGYFFYRKKIQKKNTTSRTGGEGQENTGFSEGEGQENTGFSEGEGQENTGSSQGLHYVEVKFDKIKGGAVQPGPQNDTAEYVELQVNKSRPKPSSPPSYDDHWERQKGTAPQPPNATQVPSSGLRETSRTESEGSSGGVRPENGVTQSEGSSGGVRPENGVTQSEGSSGGVRPENVVTQSEGSSEGLDQRMGRI